MAFTTTQKSVIGATAAAVAAGLGALFLQNPPGVGLNSTLAGTNAHFLAFPGATADTIAGQPINQSVDPFSPGQQWPDKFTQNATAWMGRYGMGLNDGKGGYPCGPSNEAMPRLAAALTKACNEDPSRIGSLGSSKWDCQPLTVEVYDAAIIGGKFENCVGSGGGWGWKLTRWAESSGGGGGGGGGGGTCPPGQACRPPCPECPTCPVCPPPPTCVAIPVDSQLMVWANTFCNDPLWSAARIGQVRHDRLCGQLRRTQEWCKP